MDHTIDITEAITALIKLMVNHPEDVIVECLTTSEGCFMSVSVNPADIGQVIGKQGRTAKSLRALVAAMGMASKQRIILDIRN